MKNIVYVLFLLSGLCFGQNMFAQSVPQGMRYQAVARDLNGNPLQNRSISLLIGIHAGDARGEAVYQETHRVTTDIGGQFAITVGNGKVLQGAFKTIPWGSAEMWLTVALDEQGKDNFKQLTASQLWSVPYAFHAGTAASFPILENEQESTKPCQATGIPFWTNLGNVNVSDTCHFIGTVYAVDFILKTNSIERMRITKDGEVIIPGTLEVENLHVTNDADIDHNLNVDNDVDIDHNLHVTNDVDIDHNLNVDNEVSIGSRLIVNGGVSGSDQNINNYPVLVQGSNQGVAIKVTGSRNTSNNFVSFWDQTGGMHGRIEGQTSSEVLNSFEYIWESTMLALQVGFLGAEAGCAGAQLDACEAALLVAQAVELGLEWGKMTDEMVNNAGVAYESGNGDYAEWLEKANPAETFHFGEVVGVRGGKISKKTKAAEHIMVVSQNPVLLGNMPAPQRQQDFEKIAFMGQVPVRVIGKVAVGDYLLTSGRDDGYAVAVNPVDMRASDYARIVGVAWEASHSALGNLVNTAVGINTNDVANRVAQQQEELDMLKRQINQLYTQSGLPAPNVVSPNETDRPAPVDETTAPAANGSVLSIAQVDQWLEDNRELFESWMSTTKTRLEKQGADINQHPEIAAIYTDPVQFLKEQNRNGYLWDILPGSKKN